MQGRLLEEDDLQPVGFDWSKLGRIKPGEVTIRFGFGALVALVAGIAGAVAGAKVGGLFLAFPAILPASLTLIEKKEGRTKAWADASGGVIGSAGMAAFAAVAMWLLAWNPVIALIAALIAWLLVSVGLYFLFRITGLFLKTDHLLARADAPPSSA